MVTEEAGTRQSISRSDTPRTDASRRRLNNSSSVVHVSWLRRKETYHQWIGNLIWRQANRIARSVGQPISLHKQILLAVCLLAGIF